MDEKNLSEGVDHSDHTEEEKKVRGIETKMSGKEIKEKMKKKTATAKNGAKVKKAAKPAKKNGARAACVIFSENDLSKPREVIRIIPAALKMVEQFAKKRGFESTNEAAEAMIKTAFGRVATLDRYNAV